MRSSAILLAPALSTVAYATNDWTKPCFQGVCSYDLPAVDGGASGSVKIWGSANAITDITTAAGWVILGCEPDALAQDIRLVCSSTDDTGCDHLYQGAGAEGKLVRLPENCGQSAFARISRSWVHEDQSIPASVAKRLIRRDGEVPEVKGLALDTQFDAIDPTTNGDVSIAIQGTTVPGQNGDLTVVPAPARRRRANQSRGLFSFVTDALAKFSAFDENITKDLPPIDVDKDFTIFDEKISCPPIDAGLTAKANAKVHAVISLGLVASGSIVPPKLDAVGVFTGLNADLTGTLTLSGSAVGKADSGKINLFQVGIPGLDFPGIITVGPTFKIDAQATAELDVNVDVSLALNYNIKDAKLFFPPNDQTSGGTFTPTDSPLKITASPSAAVSGTVSAHIIPTIDLGVSALGGLASATIFLDLDASASVTLSANAATQVALVGGDGAAAAPDVNACVDIGAALDVNAGADGSFFGLFDKSTQVSLFSKKFELFNKCVNGAPAKRNINSTRRSRMRSLSRSVHITLKTKPKRDFGLTCPAGQIPAALSLIDQSIPSADIKAL